MAPVTDLRSLVERRLRELGDRTGPMSVRAAADRSRGQVSYETLRLIAVGQHSGKISPQVAEGLSLALDVPVSSIYQAAGRPRPQGRFDLPERADALNARERKAVLSVIDAILAAHEDERAGRQDGPGLRAVARKRGDKRGR